MNVTVTLPKHEFEALVAAARKRRAVIESYTFESTMLANAIDAICVAVADQTAAFAAEREARMVADYVAEGLGEDPYGMHEERRRHP